MSKLPLPLKLFIGNSGYAIFKLYMNINHKTPQVLSTSETVNYIIKKKYSIARYGDGEFLWAFQDRQEGNFEKNSTQLAKRLKDILITPHPNLIIGIPDVFSTLKNMKPESKTYWEGLMIRHGKDILDLLDQEVYGNTFFTRPYMDDIDKKRNFNNDFKHIKQIWNNRNVLIVEGNQTRFGVGNDLLSNSKSVHRIIGPSINAFESYNRIFNMVKKKANNIDDVLVLTSLGPTATVLTADLSQLNIQTIDIGHLDIEYEWFKRRTKEKIPIEGKYVNEAIPHFIGELDNQFLEKYKKEIIAVIR